METEGYEVYKDPEFHRFLRSIARAPFTTVEEERQLAAQVAEGGSARQAASKRLVESHMRLVVSIACKFLGGGVSVQDLVQEGTLGLYAAIEKFEPDQGRFKTYASWWVRTYVANAIMNQARTVRVPINVLRMAREITRAAAAGNRPSDAALAEMLGVDERRMREIERAGLVEVSTDAPASDDPNSELTVGDTIADPNSVDMDEDMDRRALVQAVHAALDSLGERDRRIVIRRFGLDGEEAATLEDLSEEYGVTRERIRQLQVKALEKLRDGKVGKVLKRFVG